MNNQRLFLLGLLFIAALSILAFYTLFLTDIHLFSKPILKTVYFPEAYGLRAGDPVQVSGLRIGRVKELDFDINAEPKKRIKALLSLEKEVELLQGASITIQESTLLGGRHVDIYPGEFGSPPLEPSDEGAYYGAIKKNPIATLGDIGTLLNENRESLKNILDNAATITGNVKDGKGLIGRLISDEELSNHAADVVANFKDASEQMKTGQGLLGALIYDPELKSTVTDTFDSFKKLGGDIESGQGVLGKLIYDQALRDRVTGGLEAFANVGTRLDRGEGTLGKLISDDTLADDLQVIVTNLRGASEDIENVTSQVRTGEGTLGKLISDSGLYEDAQRAVRLLGRSLEDYREAAPITAFTGVLFAAF